MENSGLLGRLDASLADLPALIEVVSAAIQAGGQADPHTVLQELASRHGDTWSLLHAIRTAVVDDKMHRKASACLIPAVQFLQLSCTEICDLLAFFRRQAPRYLWSLRGPLHGLFTLTKSLGRECTDYAIAHPDDFSLDDIEMLATAFATASSDTALVYFRTICASSSERTNVASLCGVSVIAFADGAKALSPYIKNFRAAAEEARNSERTAFSAWLVLCQLSEIDASLRPEIELAAELGPNESKLAICSWLPSLPVGCWLDDEYSHILRRLLAGSIEAAAIRQKVDGTFAMLFDKSVLRPVVVQACDVLCDPDHQIELKEMFPSIYDTIASEATLFCEVSTRWLLKEKIATTPLRSLLRHAYIDPQYLAPKIHAFVAADPCKRLKAVRRVLGISPSGPAICHFMFALAKASELQPWGLEAFREVFMNYLFIEFPGAAGEFLREQLTETQAGTPIGVAIAELLASLTEWDEVLRSLPEAKELQPSAAKLWALRRVWAHEQREIHRQAEAQSVLSQFVTKVNVKQGRKVVTRVPGQPPRVMELKPMSHSFELPGSERSDPIWGLRQRLLYLRDES